MDEQDIAFAEELLKVHRPETRPRTVDVHINGLRRRLGGYADQYIETIRRDWIQIPASSTQGLGLVISPWALPCSAHKRPLGNCCSNASPS
jgi:hypothetical protein